MILWHLVGATGRGMEKAVGREGKCEGAGSQKTHLVVSVGCVVLEECDALAVQAPIVPLPLLGEVFVGEVVCLPSQAQPLTLSPPHGPGPRL